jgi:hypothetical protein
VPAAEFGRVKERSGDYFFFIASFFIISSFFIAPSFFIISSFVIRATT